jgi:dimeric dUTPase (all-alpha-NTP-PPase superfamily)
MLNKSQIKVMLEMQNKMNKTVHPEWVTKGWDYMRAAALETAEAVEHHGWKWWKAQKKDIPQLQMELIDIWHFYLSRYLQLEEGNEEQALNVVISDLNAMADNVTFDKRIYYFKNLNILEKLDVMAGLACAKRFSLGLFFSVCQDVGLTMENIYEQYVQKNTLNIFRQAKGYKEGKYHKEWFGLEDNVCLVDIALKLNSSDENYAKQIWEQLELFYAKALEAKKTLDSGML